MMRDLGVCRRRRRHVEEAVTARAVCAIFLEQALAEALVAAHVREIAADVMQRPREALPDLILKGLTRELRDSILHRRAELLVAPVAAGESDDGEARRQQPLAREVVQRRHELARRQVAGRAEHDERTGVGRARQAKAGAERVECSGGHFGLASAATTACPPNSFRSAACTFALNEAS